MRNKLIGQSFFFALGEGVYIFLIALLARNAEKIFGDKPAMLGIIMFLLLFVFSAALSGALILGKPILLYLEGKKREALEFFGFTLGWIFIFLLVLFVLITMFR